MMGFLIASIGNLAGGAIFYFAVMGLRDLLNDKGIEGGLAWLIAAVTLFVLMIVEVTCEVFVRVRR
jgi:hypothetical protein